MRVVMALPVHRRLDQILFFHRIPLLAVVEAAEAVMLMPLLVALVVALDEEHILVELEQQGRGITVAQAVAPAPEVVAAPEQ